MRAPKAPATNLVFYRGTAYDVITFKFQEGAFAPLPPCWRPCSLCQNEKDPASADVFTRMHGHTTFWVLGASLVTKR